MTTKTPTYVTVRPNALDNHHDAYTARLLETLINRQIHKHLAALVLDAHAHGHTLRKRCSN